MKKSIRLIAAIAVFLMLPVFTTTVRAEPDEEYQTTEIEIITEELPVLPEDMIPDDVPTEGQDDPITDYPVNPPSAFTPAGTGTVIDNATDNDGKEFFTIMAQDESIFFLVIDRQRTTENVYFLNAVTVADLMALVEIPDIPEPTIHEGFVLVTETEPEPETPSEPEKSGNSNTPTIIFIVAVVLICGGAGFYFKVYKPKQQKTEMEEDYAEAPDHYYTNEDNDAPPWDEDYNGADDTNNGTQE